jgi:hypothetical protein
MANFFRKLSRERLYKQWIDNEGLPPEDLPEDLKKDSKDAKDTDDNSLDGMNLHREVRTNRGQQTDNIFSLLSVRFIYIVALIIAILLVVVSVLSTILIMRAC